MLNKHFKSIEEYLEFYGLKFADTEHKFVPFKSNGFELAGQVYIPKEYKATVIFVHGYTGHCGLLSKIIKYLLENNYAVAAFDLLGHGLSSGKPLEIDDFSQYTNLLNDFLEIVKTQLHGPFHIIGHSTGCTIIMDYLIEQNEDFFDKIIFAAPLVRCTLWNLAKIAYTIYSPLGLNIFRVIRTISSDKEFIKFLKYKDPLQAKSVPMNWVKAMFKWNEKIIRQNRHPERSEGSGHQKSEILNKPILVIQGTNDKTVAWRYNLKFIQSKFSRAEIELIPNARHELFNESADLRKEVFSLIADYLKSR